MNRREQRGRFENAMGGSGLIRVPNEDLPHDWAKMSQKERTRWLHNYAIDNGAVTRPGN